MKKYASLIINEKGHCSNLSNRPCKIGTLFNRYRYSDLKCNFNI